MEQRKIHSQRIPLVTVLVWCALCLELCPGAAFDYDMPCVPGSLPLKKRTLLSATVNTFNVTANKCALDYVSKVMFRIEKPDSILQTICEVPGYPTCNMALQTRGQHTCKCESQTGSVNSYLLDFFFDESYINGTLKITTDCLPKPGITFTENVCTPSAAFDYNMPCFPGSLPLNKRTLVSATVNTFNVTANKCALDYVSKVRFRLEKPDRSFQTICEVPGYPTCNTTLQTSGQHTCKCESQTGSVNSYLLDFFFDESYINRTLKIKTDCLPKDGITFTENVCTPSDGCLNKKCNGHRTCVRPYGVCQCAEGYSGNNCDKDTDYNTLLVVIGTLAGILPVVAACVLVAICKCRGRNVTTSAAVQDPRGEAPPASTPGRLSEAEGTDTGQHTREII